ncbi:hypothetical protein DSM25558_0186 [Agrobacterium sp. DSM 25558]|uniref:sce7726 family protein n=1 Tax=Agrobacterium sp. DSM 25558 TaxID=1907665 RepID=UPI0009725C67|nr:sce7726 family protein [Agrobacterium sp. DSM 25558]SCX00845.1 hypothetical protein DSM25558_0186 [Agrobacterium sp. DSM 25558]
MRDADVRSAICDHLVGLHSNDRDTMIIEEMGIWAGAVRVDVAVINGEMHGFELKSAKDTLQRLPAQRVLYDRVFDRVTLVVADKHQAKAMSLIPDWWGVITAADASDGVVLSTYRESSLNPAIDPLQVARLLWREEAIDCLARWGGTKGFKSAGSEKLAQELSQRLPIADLCSEVRSVLKQRPNWLRQVLSDERKMAISVDLHPL